jgi:hypothetical protein
VQDASEISFVYQSKISSSDVDETIQLKDQLTQQWVTLDSRRATTTDTSKYFVIKDDPARFVATNGNIQVKIIGQDINESEDPWTLFIDRLSATVLDQ